MNTIKFDAAVHPTYKQQFDKLTEAYIKGEVNPMDRCACFVGNLLGGKNWNDIIDRQGFYTADEIGNIEWEFMFNSTKQKLGVRCWLRNFGDNPLAVPSAEDEQILFESFSHTLEVLKQIHISKGEIIDAAPEFKKRVPCTQ